MSLFVPTRPEFHDQQYKSWSHQASHCMDASFPSFLFRCCPFSAAGQFFQKTFIQSTAPMHPGSPIRRYFCSIPSNSVSVGLLLRYRSPYISMTSFRKSLKYCRPISSDILVASSRESAVVPEDNMRRQLRSLTSVGFPANPIPFTFVSQFSGFLSRRSDFNFRYTVFSIENLRRNKYDGYVASSFT